MKKCCTFFEDLLPYIILDPILSAASVISQNLIIHEVPWQKSHPPILHSDAHAILSILIMGNYKIWGWAQPHMSSHSYQMLADLVSLVLRVQMGHKDNMIFK